MAGPKVSPKVLPKKQAAESVGAQGVKSQKPHKENDYADHPKFAKFKKGAQ